MQWECVSEMELQIEQSAQVDTQSRLEVSKL